MNEFPYKATMLHQNWSPQVQQWLRKYVGSGNFQYHKPQNAFKCLQYVFRDERDATAFRLMFG